MKISSRAFTLLELLVVMLIVAVLAVLIFSGSQALVKQSLLTRCSQNLRQLHNAFQLYVGDHDGGLPDKHPRRYYSYLSSAATDIYTDSAFTCPAIQRSDNAAVGAWHRNYSVNIYATTEKIVTPDKAARILAPAQMLLFTEGVVISDGQDPDGRSGKIYFSTTRLEDLPKWLAIHGGRQNAVFVDGSVRLIDSDEFYQGGKWNTLFWRGY